MEVFVEWVKPLAIFAKKKPHLRCLAGFWTRLSLRETVSASLLKKYSNASVYCQSWENLKNSFFKEHLPCLLLWIWMYKILSHNLPDYGIRLSHIFKIPSISKEKPIKILGILNKKFRNTRFYTSWIWNT